MRLVRAISVGLFNHEAAFNKQELLTIIKIKLCSPIPIFRHDFGVARLGLVSGARHGQTTPRTENVQTLEWRLFNPFGH